MIQKSTNTKGEDFIPRPFLLVVVRCSARSFVPCAPQSQLKPSPFPRVDNTTRIDIKHPDALIFKIQVKGKRINAGSPNINVASLTVGNDLVGFAPTPNHFRNVRTFPDSHHFALVFYHLLAHSASTEKNRHEYEVHQDFFHTYIVDTSINKI